ncbi:MAG TPA: carboxypeptidase-like regulatory domain-containing protein, partial [Gemmatimonadaceae bacterium]
MHWRAAVLAALFALAPAVHAQVVRGVVTERVSGARIPGVVVTVASVGDSLRLVETRHALTNARGEYAVTLPGAGTYALSAKRIGVARYDAPVLALRAGETKRLDISLARFDYKLPTVRVAATNLC